jgi:hypothetical protein
LIQRTQEDNPKTVGTRCMEGEIVQPTSVGAPGCYGSTSDLVDRRISCYGLAGDKAASVLWHAMGTLSIADLTDVDDAMCAIIQLCAKLGVPCKLTRIAHHKAMVSVISDRSARVRSLEGWYPFC